MEMYYSRGALAFYGHKNSHTLRLISPVKQPITLDNCRKMNQKGPGENHSGSANKREGIDMFDHVQGLFQKIKLDVNRLEIEIGSFEKDPKIAI